MSVMTRSLATDVAALVEMVTLGTWEPCTAVPVLSGTPAATFCHSVIWPIVLATPLTKVALAIPPGLPHEYQISVRPAPAWFTLTARTQPAGAVNAAPLAADLTVAIRKVPAVLAAGRVGTTWLAVGPAVTPVRRLVMLPPPPSAPAFRYP